MEFFKSADETAAGGVAVYDANELKSLKSKCDRLRASFDSMEIKVEALMKESRRNDAKAVVSNLMGTFKPDIRTVSKSLVGNDILLRGEQAGLSGTREAKFDYTTGSFTLKPLAADAESVINLINDLYFNSIPTASPEAVVKELADARVLFDDWEALALKQVTP